MQFSVNSFLERQKPIQRDSIHLLEIILSSFNPDNEIQLVKFS